MTVRAGTDARRRRPRSGSDSLGRAAARELALITALVVAYRLGRLTTAGEAGMLSTTPGKCGISSAGFACQ